MLKFNSPPPAGTRAFSECQAGGSRGGFRIANARKQIRHDPLSGLSCAVLAIRLKKMQQY